MSYQGSVPTVADLPDNLTADNKGYVYTVLSNNHEYLWDGERYLDLADSKSFVYEQGQPARVWTINHALNKFPSVTVVDSAGSVVIGDIYYDDENTLTVSFSSEFSGKAYLN